MSVAQKISAASALRPDIATAIDTAIDIAAFTRELAARYSVNFVESDLDRFTAAASRLSDAEVDPDETEDLLVELARTGVISPSEGMALHAAHLRQMAG
jgi:hypothetical protein